ncbi:MAG: histidine phosphatase family protein [Aestuariibacter sp.]
MEKQAEVKHNPSLTAAGLQQAKRLAEQLKNKNITAIYSTDYARTQETAAPLAKALGIEITSYDPSDLRTFANNIKNLSQNALIVGHSNTTPALTYLLSGQPQYDIDESDYNNLFEVSFNNKITTATKHFYQPQPQNISGLHLSSKHLRDIDASYRMLFRGQPVGTASYAINVEKDNIHFTEITTIEGFDIDTTITAIANKTMLTPKSMTMAGTMAGPADIHLKWGKTQKSDYLTVTGSSLMPRARYKAQGQLEIDRNLPAGTVERTAALLAVPFYDLDKTTAFNWYNGYEDHSRTITVSQLGMETITVPAGTFHTNKVKLQGGAPSQLFYLSNEPQPKVVKIEILGMPWVYELTSID